MSYAWEMQKCSKFLRFLGTETTLRDEVVLKNSFTGANPLLWYLIITKTFLNETVGRVFFSVVSAAKIPTHYCTSSAHRLARSGLSAMFEHMFFPPFSSR